jgi:hypothetical protein
MILSAVFTGTFGLIYAQPIEPNQFTVLLTSAGCPARCFMGVHSGMTADEAALILAQHIWVDYVIREAHVVSWSWDGSQPAYLYNRQSTRGTIYGGVVQLRRGRVSSINVVVPFLGGDLFVPIRVADQRT